MKKFQTYLCIDKPIYKKGDNLFARGIILSDTSNTPLLLKDFDKYFFLGAEFQILGINYNNYIRTKWRYYIYSKNIKI
jgi:hypothetical protein